MRSQTGAVWDEGLTGNTVSGSSEDKPVNKLKAECVKKKNKEIKQGRE